MLQTEYLNMMLFELEMFYFLSRLKYVQNVVTILNSIERKHLFTVSALHTRINVSNFEIII